MSRNSENAFEKKIDERIANLITQSYSQPDGNVRRRKLQKLQEERYRIHSGTGEPYEIQRDEYFRNDGDYKNVLDPTDPIDSKYITQYETYKNTLNDLKRWKGNRMDDINVKRETIKKYLQTTYDNELAPPDDHKSYSVPELFIKIRDRTDIAEGNGTYKVTNIADLVNHFHYKIMVDRDIPVNEKSPDGDTTKDKQWSSENVIGICKMARLRLEPFVRAFINTFELTDPNIRRVYAIRDNNLSGQPLPKSGPKSNFPNNMTGMTAALAANALYGANFGQGGGMHESLNTTSNLFKELNNLSQGYNNSIKDTSKLLNDLNNEYKGMNQGGAGKHNSKNKSSTNKSSKKKSKKKC